VTVADVTDVISRLRANPQVAIKIDGTTISVGRICDIEIGGSRDDRGSFVNVSGFDMSGQAALSDLPVGFHAHGEQTFTDLIRAAVEPWGLPVVTSNALNRAAITYRTVVPPPPPDVSPEVAAALARDRAAMVAAGQTPPPAVAAEQTVTETAQSREMHARPGEGVVEWIRRVAEQHHLLVWCTALGELFVGRPNYDQAPAIRIMRRWGAPVCEGTIVDASWVERYDTATSIHVVGRVGRGGATSIDATETDTERAERGWDVRRVVSEDGMRDQAAAESKAKQLLRAEQLGAVTYRARFAGHGVGRRMVAPDTIVEVSDDVCGLDGMRLYCVSREFSLDRDAGASCEIECVRPGLWGAD
jgi:prophage tail gpP-like protein